MGVVNFFLFLKFVYTTAFGLNRWTLANLFNFALQALQNLIASKLPMEKFVNFITLVLHSLLEFLLS